MLLFFICLTAYLIGSVNSAILVFRALGKKDPRQSYSKNPGATNVYRQAGPFWAFVVLSLDMGKAALTAWISLWLLPKGLVPLVGLFLLAGNRYPVFHGFSGGKGVGHYLGFCLAATPVAALLSVFFWALGRFFSGHPFIGSFCMVAVLAVGQMVYFTDGIVPFAVILATVIWIAFAHKENIRSFIAG